jgi:hypothetical protein
MTMFGKTEKDEKYVTGDGTNKVQWKRKFKITRGNIEPPHGMSSNNASSVSRVNELSPATIARSKSGDRSVIDCCNRMSPIRDKHYGFVSAIDRRATDKRSNVNRALESAE